MWPSRAPITRWPMRILELELQHFRNYSGQRVSFDPDCNVIIRCCCWTMLGAGLWRQEFVLEPHPRGAGIHHLLRGRPAAAAVGRKDLPCQKWHCAVMNTATERNERSCARQRVLKCRAAPRRITCCEDDQLPQLLGEKSSILKKGKKPDQCDGMGGRAGDVHCVSLPGKTVDAVHDRLCHSAQLPAWDLRSGGGQKEQECILDLFSLPV